MKVAARTSLGRGLRASGLDPPVVQSEPSSPMSAARPKVLCGTLKSQGKRPIGRGAPRKASLAATAPSAVTNTQPVVTGTEAMIEASKRTGATSTTRPAHSSKRSGP